MKFADRLKVSSTGTSAASLTLGAALLGCRTLAQVIALGEMAVGETNIPFTVDDGAGNVQTGLYNIASTTQITLVAILSSSNSGKAVTFSGSPLTVWNGDSSSVMNAGYINPHDAGFDIILCAGQSNMTGQAMGDSTLDVTDPRVFAWGGYSGESSTYQKVYLASDPLRHYAGVSGGMGPATWFGKTYAGAIPSNRKVLLVPVAQGATSMVSIPAAWAPGDGTAGGGLAGSGVLYENAVAQGNAALAAAQLMYPNSRIVGCIWLQGESDAAGHVGQIRYASALKTLIQGFRARLIGAANMWFSIIGMIGDVIASGDGSTAGSYYQTIDLAHQQVAAEVPRCSYTQGVTGYPIASYNIVHYNAIGARLMGCRSGANIGAALFSKGNDTTPPVVLSASVANAAPTVVQIVLSEPYDPAYPPQLAAWTVSGHTVSAATGSGNIIYLTVLSPFVSSEAARTVTFTAQGNGIRDLSGNLMVSQSPVGITNSVLANATGISLSGPGTGVAGQVTSNYTVGVLPVGANIPGGSITVAVSDGTVTNNVTLTTAVPTSATNFTEASAGTYSITAASAGLTSAPPISLVVSAATGPTFSSAQIANVAPSNIVITMSGTLGTSVPPASSFAVTENGTATAKTIGTPVISGATVTLPMSGSFAQGTAVQVTYTQPGANPRIQDASGNPSPSFGPATVTNNISAGSDIRFTDLQHMTETSAVAPYAYKGESGLGYTATNLGGTSVMSAAGDFTFTVKVSSVTTGQPMISVKSTSTTTNYASTKVNLFARTSGYSEYSGNGSVGAATVVTASFIPAENDLIKLVRTGTQIDVYVQRSGGSTWTQILTWSGAGLAGALYIQIIAASNGVLTAPQGIGFA